MTQDELLLQLLQRLDEPAARYPGLDCYYTGKSPLAFLSPEAKTSACGSPDSAATPTCGLIGFAATSTSSLVWRTCCSATPT